jgi:hypothetical protein
VGEMLASDRKSVQRGKPRALRSAALVAIVVAMLAFGTAGCMLPLLGAIPSVINLAHSALTSGSSPKDDAEAKNAEAAAPTVEADSPTDEAGKPPPKLTPGNLCQMMAIAHPDMVLVELRKNAAGAPEYRELHLQNSADEAHWTPVIDSDTGPGGWIPAVNFLKMDFQPPLTDVIPPAGTCYLAYAPIAIDPNNPYQAAELKSVAGGPVSTFSWAGRTYQYMVAPSVPCLSPSS